MFTPVLVWTQYGHSDKGNVTYSINVDILSTHFRYDTARTIKQGQDAYCAKALSGQWDGLGAYPENLQWEALVDVLRGHVKVESCSLRDSRSSF